MKTATVRVPGTSHQALGDYEGYKNDPTNLVRTPYKTTSLSIVVYIPLANDFFVYVKPKRIFFF